MLGYSLLQIQFLFFGLIESEIVRRYKNGLKLENPITNKSVDSYVQTEIIFIFTKCRPLFHVFFETLCINTNLYIYVWAKSYII